MSILSKYYGIASAELRAERKAAGLSQANLAERAGIGRHAVVYWERKPEKFWRGWAIQRMFKVLCLTVLSVYYTTTRARVDGDLLKDREQERLDWLCEAHNARVRARAANPAGPRHERVTLAACCPNREDDAASFMGEEAPDQGWVRARLMTKPQAAYSFCR